MMIILDITSGSGVLQEASGFGLMTSKFLVPLPFNQHCFYLISLINTSECALESCEEDEGH